MHWFEKTIHKSTGTDITSPTGNYAEQIAADTNVRFWPHACASCLKAVKTISKHVENPDMREHGYSKGQRRCWFAPYLRRCSRRFVVLEKGNCTHKKSIKRVVGIGARECTVISIFHLITLGHRSQGEVTVINTNWIMCCNWSIKQQALSVKAAFAEMEF